MTENEAEDQKAMQEEIRSRMLERSGKAIEYLDEMVNGMASDMAGCEKETGSPLDPLAATGFLQQNIALTMPMDQVVAVLSEAVYRLALDQHGKKANVSSLFLPNGSQKK